MSRGFSPGVYTMYDSGRFVSGTQLRKWALGLNGYGWSSKNTIFGRPEKITTWAAPELSSA